MDPLMNIDKDEYILLQDKMNELMVWAGESNLMLDQLLTVFACHIHNACELHGVNAFEVFQAMANISIMDHASETQH
jgi:hypothetical protein